MNLLQEKINELNSYWNKTKQDFYFFFNPDEDPNHILQNTNTTNEKSLVPLGIFNIYANKDIPSFEDTRSFGDIMRSTQESRIDVFPWTKSQEGEVFYILSSYNRLKPVGHCVKTPEGEHYEFFPIYYEDEILFHGTVLYNLR